MSADITYCKLDGFQELHLYRSGDDAMLCSVTGNVTHEAGRYDEFSGSSVCDDCKAKREECRRYDGRTLAEHKEHIRNFWR